METIDFNDIELNERVYGGMSGHKLGIVWNNENYLLKLPGNMHEKEFKNTELSYSNSPLCEFIGSHIYSFLGIPVHETVLGTRNGKCVVACKDFCSDTDSLLEFGKIKVTFEPNFTDSNGNPTNGFGTDLSEILKTIDEHPLLKKVDGVKERFWDMFIVDSLIGNIDRNNGNWGVLKHFDGSKELSPVYDNGNSFNANWDLNKMRTYLEDEKMFETVSYKGRLCTFLKNEKQLNPYHLIQSKEYGDCNNAVLRNVPKIKEKMPDIKNFINEIPAVKNDVAIISLTQKQFYNALIKSRFEKVLKPTYNEIKTSVDIKGIQPVVRKKPRDSGWER